jgi:alpha-L-rhamnosidase
VCSSDLNISTSWQITGETMEVDAVIPPNTTATLLLPQARMPSASQASGLMAKVEGIKSMSQQGKSVAVRVGSGHYNFTYPVVGP